MRQGRRFTRGQAPNGQSRRSEVDPERSSIYPDRNTEGSASRFSPARCVNLIGLVGLVALSALAPACAPELDTSRPLPKRGSVGEEMFGVICDRVGAQALREDLTGDSFRGVCHKPPGGEFADTVDVSKLPALDPSAANEKGELVSVEQQKKNRDVAVGRVEALARRRADLVRALDATFPEQKIPIKDIDNADESKSCGAPAKSGEGLLTEEIADMLGRMGDLYNDGTLPQSTESLARVMDAFKKSDEAQAAWARLSARQGYRPIETALGATRPIIAYPHLRDLSNASLRLLSADSTPYELEPKYDDEGQRIPNPGPANAALNKMLEAAHEELLATTADPKTKPLVVTTDPATGRAIINRARDNVEMMQEILFASDPSFGGGTPKYIVKRDSRGYAAIRGGAVPTPFIDADKDGLPDVDESGRFKTSNNSLAPSPFPFPGAPQATRDPAGRALAGSQLLYDYVATSHTFAAQMMSDLKPLVNPDPEAKHETLMDMLGGLHVAVGPRAQKSKSYAGGKSVEYSGIADDSPMLDLIYAMGTILGSPGVANEPAGLTHGNSDTTLALAKELFTGPENTKAMARMTGSMIAAFDIAQKHDEAKIPRTATFWDENIETMGKMAKEPGLLEDVFEALAQPESAQLGTIFSRYANLRDDITYDKNDINNGWFNLTTNNKSEMKTPVDRTKPETGKNRSAMYRFLQLINDTTGVTACNKPGAKVHAKAFGISLDLPIGSGTFAECEVFKLENLAAFYLDSIADAAQYEPDTKPNKRGAFYMRDSLLRNGVGGLGAASVGLMEDSSGITGFWTPTDSTVLSARPEWLNRLVFFDLKNDTVNAKTNTFIKDLQGEFIGTSVCPERIITDPKPNEPDASPDGKVHGLRNCPNGQWLQQRGANTLFTWENFGFYTAMKPLLGAFVKHGREDLFLELANATYKHWPGAEASADECRLAGNKTCPKAGMNTYEPLIAEALAGDVLPALSELAKVLVGMKITRCDAVDPTTKACTKPTLVTGAAVAAAATRSLLDPDYAKNVLQLKDRKGATTAKRNDGTTVSQVTPAYLLTNALGGIDIAFDTYEQQHPEDKDRRANWRRARSQLVDQFMGVSGAKSTSTFANPTMPKMTPVIIDMLRAQLDFRCPKSFVPPYEKCTWARDELTAHEKDTLTGPLASAGLDMMEAVRADKDGRHEMEVLMQYLLDAASTNDALASMLASSNDLVQLLHDDQNLVPLFHVLASAMDATVKDDKGHVKQKSLVDAQMALLARVSGRYFDKDGKEICRREIDPNQVLAVALGNIVTPINDEGFKGQSPLEVIIDVIADVNRVDPTQPYEGTLDRSDYNSVSENVVDFLTNRERGLEQFYEVIRQGTKF
ncbi:MAG: hypothetical protein JWP87_365 [Labilithrix sp.]|nr:hypothetical protein [Labilithrix sp.]